MKYAIVSILSSFEFPLREALRKQVWWLAERRRDDGFSVEIVILTDGSRPDESLVRDGIEVTSRSKYSHVVERFDADFLHVVTAIVCPKLLFLRGGRLSRRLTLTDGDVFHGPNRVLRRLIARALPRLYDDVQVFSRYQQGALVGVGARIVQPLLPHFPVIKRCPAPRPTMLYMGHLSREKGVDTILDALPKIVEAHPDAQLILADNGVQRDSEMTERLKIETRERPDCIVRKGVVDPLIELSRCWVYLYPFKAPGGTMAYPLSLWESSCCGTPFVACDVGGNAEFFPGERLIPPDDPSALAEKVIRVLHETRR